MGFERARTSRSSPADASTATTERSEGVRRGMPSGRGLSVGVYSSLPLFSSHLLNGVVSLTTIVLTPPLRHDLLPPSALLSSSITFTSTPLCPMQSEQFTRLSASPQHRLRLPPNVPMYYHPACTTIPRVLPSRVSPFTTAIDPVDRPRRLLRQNRPAVQRSDCSQEARPPDREGPTLHIGSMS